MDEISIPWPERNDKPFIDGVYGPTQAHLDWFDSFTFIKDLIIAEAFKEAAPYCCYDNGCILQVPWLDMQRMGLIVRLATYLGSG